jgi:hypothetical protein
MSSSSSSAAPTCLTILVFEKLTRDTYCLWRVQMLSATRAAQLGGFIDGSERAPEKNLEVEKDSKKVMIPNPNYTGWHVQDQHFLMYLVTSLSHKLLVGVASNSTSADMWAAITKNFASQLCSCVLHRCNHLVSTRKGDQSVLVYFSTMHAWVR